MKTLCAMAAATLILVGIPASAAEGDAVAQA